MVHCQEAWQGPEKENVEPGSLIWGDQVLSQHTYKAGDVLYLQTKGGPIGLELTGVVSRPFMMFWDKKYLKMVVESGMAMLLYKRYIDDSNQAAKVPPVGSKYDTEKRKVVQNETELELRQWEERDS